MPHIRSGQHKTMSSTPKRQSEYKAKQMTITSDSLILENNKKMTVTDMWIDGTKQKTQMCACYYHPTLDKDAKNYTMNRKTASSANSAGETGCPHVKNSNKTHSLLPCPTTIIEIHKGLKYKIHNWCIDNATLVPKAQEQSLRWGGKICRNQRTKMSAAEQCLLDLTGKLHH